MVEKITNQLPTVFRNDEITLEDINNYDMIMLSPGPGIPNEAGILKEIIRRYAGKKPIFGVCLGLQAIVEVFGGAIINMDQVFHGVATSMKVTKSDAVIFNGIQKEFQAARYHSWIASNENFPENLEITAEDEAWWNYGNSSSPFSNQCGAISSRVNFNSGRRANCQKFYRSKQQIEYLTTTERKFSRNEKYIKRFIST